MARVEGTATLERKARRKPRVERKLHELEELEENKENEVMESWEMLDFAEKYFNNHERSPEGNLNCNCLCNFDLLFLFIK